MTQSGQKRAAFAAMHRLICYASAPDPWCWEAQPKQMEKFTMMRFVLSAVVMFIAFLGAHNHSRGQEAQSIKDMILQVPNGTICQNKKTGKVTRNGHCFSRDAAAHIRAANEIFSKPDPTCAELRKAIGWVEAAEELYMEAGDVSGEARDVGRLTGWGKEFIEGLLPCDC
jgi:hypothetical protein